MIGYFGIGIEHAKNSVNIGTLLRSAYVFGASFVFTIGMRYRQQSSDVCKTWRHVPLYHYQSLDDIHIPHDCLLVGVEMVASAERLAGIKHPERAIYLLGSEDHGLTEKAQLKCHRMIQINTFRTDRSLNVSTAGSIVMYDRFVKT